MAEAASKKSQNDETESAETTPQSPSQAVGWRKFLSKNWGAALVVAAITIHGIVFTCCQIWGKTPSAPPVYEAHLGDYQFAGDKDAGGRIAAADFSLYVTLLDHTDRAARQLLAARHFRVQQDVEQLLRQAHSADFEDPNLVELKRQLQEQINQSLGVRAVAEVIITKLKLTPGGKDQGPGGKDQGSGITDQGSEIRDPSRAVSAR